MCSLKTAMALRRHVAMTAGVLIYLALLVLGSQSGMAPRLGLAGIHDKLLHVLAYGAMAGLLFVGLSSAPLRRSLTVIGIVAVLGAADELLQLTYPHHDADIGYWCADLVGAGLACGVLSGLRAACYRPASAPEAGSSLS
jgi:hypothetical protein